MTLLDLAKSMRSHPTDAEHRFWQQVRAGRLVGTKWKRQQMLGRYIVDFVCFEHRLVVELDGGQHNGASADETRDQWLLGQGLVVLRFWNNDVLTNMEGVMERVLAQLQASPSPQPLPREGGGASEASLPSRERGGREGAAKK